jgi:hypothetical protein
VLSPGAPVRRDASRQHARHATEGTWLLAEKVGMSTERAHDPGRFARAVALALKGKVVQIGPRQFEVAGNEEKSYTVDLTQDPPCTCADQWWSGTKIRSNCKHTIASKLLAKDPDVMTNLMEHAYRAQQANESLQKKTRRRSA